jgi:hypothetical protein
MNFMNILKKSEKTFLSAKKWRQSGRDYNFRGDYKFRAHCRAGAMIFFVRLCIYPVDS